MIMGPAGPRTRDDYAGEGQRQFTGNQNGGRWVAEVVSERPVIPLVEEEAQIPNAQLVLERTRIWSLVPMGPETKNICKIWNSDVE